MLHSIQVPSHGEEKWCSIHVLGFFLEVDFYIVVLFTLNSKIRGAEAHAWHLKDIEIGERFFNSWGYYSEEALKYKDIKTVKPIYIKPINKPLTPEVFLLVASRTKCLGKVHFRSRLIGRGEVSLAFMNNFSPLSRPGTSTILLSLLSSLSQKQART